MIEKFVLENYDCRQIASFWFATGNTPIYEWKHKGKKFAFYKTYVGAPACVGTVEDTLSAMRTLLPLLKYEGSRDILKFMEEKCNDL